jgi:hypothetical protein
MIDFGRAIQHPFEDKDWAVKMLIGAGVSLVPILNFAMNGYALQVQRNTALGQDVPMPRWDDLGKHLTDGLKIFVVQLIYMIPILIITFGLMTMSLVFGVSADSMRGSVRDAVGTGFIVLTLGVTCLLLLYGLVFAFIIPATTIQVARTGQIGSAFNFSEMLALIRRRTGDYVLVVVTPLIISLGFSLVFGVINIIPFVGLCITFILIPLILVINPYVTIVFGHLYGQLMRP